MPGETLSRDVALNVVGKIAGYQKELEKMPGITQKQAAASALKMQKVFTDDVLKQLKDVTKAGDVSGKAIAASYGQLGGVAAKLGETLGGPFASATVLAKDFLGPLAEAGAGLGGLGAAGLAAGAGIGVAAAGTVALIGGTKALVDGSLEARDRLLEAGDAAEIPPEALRSMKLYEDASLELNESLDLLHVTVGGFVADDLAVLVQKTSEWVTWGTKAADTTADWVRWAQSLVSLGMSEYLYDWRDAQYQVAQGAIEAAANTKLWREESAAMLSALGMLEEDGEGAGKLAGGISIARDEAVEMAKAMAQWRTEADALFRQSSVDDYVAAFDPTLKSLRAMVGATSDLKAQTDALIARNQQLMASWQPAEEMGPFGLTKEDWETHKQLADQMYGQLTEASSTFFAMLGDMRDRDLDKAMSARDREQSQLEDLYAQRAEATTKQQLADIDAAIATQKARVAATQDELAQRRSAAQRLAGWQKGQALFEVGINTASAVMKAFAMFGPPPSPVGIGAAAAAGVLGLTQVAAVAAQPMPSFFRGTSRVEAPAGAGAVQATLHRDEAVLNSSAARELGPQIIDALNAGLSPFEAVRGGVRVSNVDQLAKGIGREVARSVGREARLNSRTPTGFRPVRRR